MPLISIITPVYNAARWLPEMIASVHAQTLGDWEHILVDDGSTDESVAIAEKATRADSRVRLLRMPLNGGPAAARNLALQNAQGRFIAFLDADDLWLKTKLACQVEWMLAHTYGFVYHDYRQFKGSSVHVGSLICGPDELNLCTLHTQRGVGILTVMIDRQRIPQFQIPQGFYNYLHEDFIMWLNILQAGHAGHRLPLDLARYRLLDSSLGANKIKAARQVWRIYRNISKLSLLRATNWWIQYAWNSYWAHRYAYYSKEYKRSTSICL